jgi:predicted NAD-dependent protein-ADP-ribosyltransferase YbiA (DUF1768 family)
MNFQQIIRAKNVGLFPKGFIRPMSSKTNKKVIFVSPTADTAIGRYMSTFYKKKFTFQGVSYPTIEHAYQAIKFKNFSDNPVMWMKFRRGGSIKSPKVAQYMGSQNGLKELGVKIYEEEWEQRKPYIFRKIVFAREKQDPLFHRIVKKMINDNNVKLYPNGKNNTWDTSGALCDPIPSLHDW